MNHKTAEKINKILSNSIYTVLRESTFKDGSEWHTVSVFNRTTGSCGEFIALYEGSHFAKCEAMMEHVKHRNLSHIEATIECLYLEQEKNLKSFLIEKSISRLKDDYIKCSKSLDLADVFDISDYYDGVVNLLTDEEVNELVEGAIDAYNHDKAYPEN